MLADKPRKRRRSERRIVVEMISHAEIARLEARDEAVRAEISQLRGEVNGLRKLLFDFAEAYGPPGRRR